MRFSATAGTIQSVIQPFGAATGDVGDDEADIEALGRRLDARGHASLTVPGLGESPDQQHDWAA